MTLTPEGRQAVIDSIEHWNRDIVAELEKGRKIRACCWLDTDAPVPMSAWHCPLCKMCRMSIQGCVDCSRCPYVNKYFNPCDDEDNEEAWAVFRNEPTLAHARAMVKKLEGILQ